MKPGADRVCGHLDQIHHGNVGRGRLTPGCSYLFLLGAGAAAMIRLAVAPVNNIPHTPQIRFLILRNSRSRATAARNPLSWNLSAFDKFPLMLISI